MSDTDTVDDADATDTTVDDADATDTTVDDADATDTTVDDAYVTALLVEHDYYVQQGKTDRVEQVEAELERCGHPVKRTAEPAHRPHKATPPKKATPAKPAKQTRAPKPAKDETPATDEVTTDPAPAQTDGESDQTPETPAG